MKVLSLWEPWGTAMRLGLKTVETRDICFSYRGPLAIHCARKPFLPADYDDAFVKRATIDILDGDYEDGYVLDSCVLAYGCVVCFVDLRACVSVESVRDTITQRERFWGNYTDGRKALITSMLHSLKSPISLRGRPGLFDWPEGDSVLAKYRSAS